MQVKLDENLGERGRKILADAGHDVATVADQGLESAPDAELIDVCRQEDRCLVTLDLDFSNPFVFPPGQFAGIAVVRLLRHTSPDDLYTAVGTLAVALARESIKGKLWCLSGRRSLIQKVSLSTVDRTIGDRTMNRKLCF